MGSGALLLLLVLLTAGLLGLWEWRRYRKAAGAAAGGTHIAG